MLRGIKLAALLLASQAFVSPTAIDDTGARPHAGGAELVGEVAQNEDRYRFRYVRGPAGIIVALAEELF